jgi:two-component system LytT family response regulator
MVVLVVDDEKKARNLLSTILREYCDDVSVVLEASNLMDGVREIKEHQPNVVFMDIEMPDYLGIEIFDFLEEKEICFQLIFTTAYSHYAIKAFEINAIDYLLKPLRPNHVRKALQKATQQLSQQVVYQQLEALRASSNSNNTLKKIGIPVNNGILFVQISDIICLEADGMYTKIWLKDKKPTLTSKPLKHFIGILKHSALFYRAHRSFLINLQSVVQYSKKEGAVITLENEKVIPLSRSKKEEFLNLLNTNGIQLL